VSPLPADTDGGVQVQGLWGKIDDSIVEETFQRHFDAFLDCYEREGLEILEEMEGELGVYLIVGPDGHVTDELYFESGSLGSDATQQCLLDRISRIVFQKPIGGYHAKVRYAFPFEAPYDHPAPFDWSGDPIEKVVSADREAVDACLGGESGVTLTVYVGRGGKVLAAGGAAATQTGYQAARCLSARATAWQFADPGKLRPAKATIEF